MYNRYGKKEPIRIKLGSTRSYLYLLVYLPDGILLRRAHMKAIYILRRQGARAC